MTPRRAHITRAPGVRLGSFLFLLATSCCRALALGRPETPPSTVFKFSPASFLPPRQICSFVLLFFLPTRRSFLLMRFLGFEVRLNSPALKVFDSISKRVGMLFLTTFSFVLSS